MPLNDPNFLRQGIISVPKFERSQLPPSGDHGKTAPGEEGVGVGPGHPGRGPGRVPGPPGPRAFPSLGGVLSCVLNGLAPCPGQDASPQPGKLPHQGFPREQSRRRVPFLVPLSRCVPSEVPLDL